MVASTTTSSISSSNKGEHQTVQRFETCFPNIAHSQYGQHQQGGYPGSQPQNQFPQQGPYGQDQYPQGQNAYGQPGQQQYGSSDPAMQAEGDRGLLGAVGGGAAGYFGGNKLGGHGIIGAIAGAVLGSKLEDHHKKPKNDGYGGYNH
jgi:hypothetical protein